MITIETILKSGNVNQDKYQWNYQEVIKNNKDKIFIYDYPITSLLKDDFETHFCSHFYKHDLAFQNIGEFCYYLSEHLNNLFPYMNTYFEKIGNYEELMSNLGYDETRTIEHNEDTTYGSTQNGNTQTDDTVNNENTRLGRDFPNSEIMVTSEQYYTDSDSAKGKQTSQNKQQNTFNQNDDTTRDFTENEMIHHINNDNINVYDFLIKYRKDIDSIYDMIYEKMSDLFIAIM